MSKLHHLEVKGFKSIRELDLALQDMNVLIGANGSGKSNFISLFQMLNRLIEEKLQVYVGQAGGVDSIFYYGQKMTDQMSVKLDFAPNSYVFSLVPTLDASLVFDSENCYFHGAGYPEPYKVLLGSGHEESRLHWAAENNQSKVPSHILRHIESWTLYHFQDTSASARVKQPGDINDNEFLRPDASNLAAFLYRLHENHKGDYNNIVGTIRMVAPFFHDFNLRPDPLNQGKIRLEWSEKESDSYFNAHSLSDGTLRFICLATLLLQPELPSLVLLDEPELGLHPYAITLLAELLKSAASKTQVIISTQSVTLVNQFDYENIIVVDREEKQSVFRRLDQNQMAHWLEEYGLGDLWEKNLLGGRPAHE